MKFSFVSMIFVLVVISLLGGCDHVADVETVGYAFPSVANIAAMSHTEVTQNAKNNLPVHHRELVDHEGASGVVSPNNDTLYSGISIDMSHSPQFLELPALEDTRYQSMMVTDMRAYNIAEFVNNGQGGRFMFAVKGYQGDIPEGTRLIESESDVLLVLIRTEVFNATDLPNVHLIQDHIKVSPLLNIVPNITVFPDLPKIDPDNLKISVMSKWVEMAQWAMRHSPKLDTKDARYKERINRLKPGILNKIVFAYGVYKLRKEGAKMTSTKGLYGPRAEVTENHWARGAITTVSHLAMSYKRASYPTFNVDINGDELVGCHTYTATFKDVPVNAFWSLTVYKDSDKQLVPNDLKKYRVSDKTAVAGQDGSVIIHLGGNPVADNYLPLPEDCAEWYTIVRLYEPQEKFLNGSWKVPSIVKIK